MGKLEVGTLDKVRGTEERTERGHPTKGLSQEGGPPRVVQLPLFEEG